LAATCAACLDAISPREKFVLSGTECFHARCAMTRGTAQSVRRRLELEIIDHRAAIERLRADLTSERSTARHERQVTARIAKERDELSAEVRDAARQREQLIDIHRTAERRLTAEYERVLVERDQARREIAVLRDHPDSKPENTDRDATEIRFSLLELDKT